jgi:PAS domain-containing protein
MNKNLSSQALEERTTNAVLSNSADAIVGTNRDGMIPFWNSGAERGSGFAQY